MNQHREDRLGHQDREGLVTRRDLQTEVSTLYSRLVQRAPLLPEQLEGLLYGHGKNVGAILPTGEINVIRVAQCIRAYRNGMWDESLIPLPPTEPICYPGGPRTLLARASSLPQPYHLSVNVTSDGQIRPNGLMELDRGPEDIPSKGYWIDLGKQPIVRITPSEMRLLGNAYAAYLQHPEKK